MRPIRTLSLVLLLCAAASGAQTAGGAAPGSRRLPPVAPTQPAAGLTLKEVRETFAKADADHSNGLSADEAAFGGLDATAFAAGDSDLDSKLTAEEFIVASEGRVARQGSGVAADLTAESTRLQALRRAQKSEELKTRREAKAAAPSTPAAGAAASDAPAATSAQPGPAAARRALAPATTAEKERTAEEIRAAILRRVRNGEISADDARKALEAVDRRIANTGGATGGGLPAAAPADAGASTPPLPIAGADEKLTLREIEEALARRVRNSELDPAKAEKLYGDTIRRIENVRGAGTGEPGATTGAGAGEPAAPATVDTPAAQQGFRARIAEAQGELTRRLRNAEITPEQAALEEAALTKRLRQAAEGLKAGTTPGGAGSGDGSSTATTGATDPKDSAPSPTPTQPSPVRPSRESPAAEPAPPARRASEATPTAPLPPAPTPARGSTPAPAAKPATPPPAPTPAEKGDGTTKPARPAPPAPQPARPSSGGGG